MLKNKNEALFALCLILLLGLLIVFNLPSFFSINIPPIRAQENLSENESSLSCLVDATNCGSLNYPDIMYGKIAYEDVWNGAQFINQKVCKITPAGCTQNCSGSSWSFAQPGCATVEQIDTCSSGWQCYANSKFYLTESCEWQDYQSCSSGCDSGECIAEGEITCATDDDCNPDETSYLCADDGSICKATTRYRCMNNGQYNSYCDPTYSYECGEPCQFGCEDGSCISPETHWVVGQPLMCRVKLSSNGTINSLAMKLATDQITRSYAAINLWHDNNGSRGEEIYSSRDIQLLEDQYEGPQQVVASEEFENFSGYHQISLPNISVKAGYYWVGMTRLDPGQSALNTFTYDDGDPNTYAEDYVGKRYNYWDCYYQVNYSQQQLCRETDFGKDFYNYGVISTDDETISDYCEALNSNTLTEFYCQDGELTVQKYECPYGCKDNKCLPYPEDLSRASSEYVALKDKARELDLLVTGLERYVVDEERKLISTIDNNLANRLKGKILLQVEANGEAWYVDPATLKRFYLKDGESAYNALRLFGLGITNENLNKIPVGIEERAETIDYDSDGLGDKLEEALGTDTDNRDTDGDGFNDGDEVKTGFDPLGPGKINIDNNLVNTLKGKIVLQVESRGEAWYINPDDGKRYYMKDGALAYQIMRFLSLGITNDNLRKIDVGEF